MRSEVTELECCPLCGIRVAEAMDAAGFGNDCDCSGLAGCACADAGTQCGCCRTDACARKSDCGNAE